jgi:hypothetical protein
VSSFSTFSLLYRLKGYFHDSGYHRPEVEVVVDSRMKIVTYMASVVRIVVDSRMKIVTYMVPVVRATLTSEQTVKSLK